MDSGICGEIGADTTVLSNGSLTGVINDGYSFGNTALAKGGIHGGKGNLATKSITSPVARVVMILPVNNLFSLAGAFNVIVSGP